MKKILIYLDQRNKYSSSFYCFCFCFCYFLQQHRQYVLSFYVFNLEDCLHVCMYLVYCVKRFSIFSCFTYIQMRHAHIIFERNEKPNKRNEIGLHILHVWLKLISILFYVHFLFLFFLKLTNRAEILIQYTDAKMKRIQWNLSKWTITWKNSISSSTLYYISMHFVNVHTHFLSPRWHSCIFYPNPIDHFR